MLKTQFRGYICGIITTYQQILIILYNFEIIVIGALFPPGTAVLCCGDLKFFPISSSTSWITRNKKK